MDPRVNIRDAIGIFDRTHRLPNPQRPGAPLAHPRRNDFDLLAPDFGNRHVWPAPRPAPLARPGRAGPRIPFGFLPRANRAPPPRLFQWPQRPNVPGEASPEAMSAPQQIRYWCLDALRKKLSDDDNPPAQEPDRLNLMQVLLGYQPPEAHAGGEEIDDRIPPAQRPDRPNPRPVPLAHQPPQAHAGREEIDDRAQQMLRDIERNLDPEIPQDQQQLEIMRHLINVVGVDVNHIIGMFDGCSCLFLAIQQHNYELARLLLNAGALTESSDQRPDMRLLGLNLSSTNFLLTSKFQSLNPLYFSMQLCDRKMASILIETGTDISQVDYKTAVKMDHLDVIRRSLELGLNVNTLVKHGLRKNQCTILHLAAMLNKPDMLNYLLLEWNANVNVCDSEGLTPLSFAVKSGHQQCVETLLAHHNNLPAYQDSSLLALAIRKGVEDRDMSPFRSYNLPSRGEPSSEKTYADIIDLLVRHVAMLQTQGPFVDPDTYIQIEKSTNAKDFMNICKFELERMKASPINDTITFYDVLVKKDLGLFLRDESVVRLLESPFLDRNFPIYGKLMRDRFEIKRKKMEFENKVISGLSKIFGLDLSACHLIYNHILQHLKPVDLHSLSNI